MHAAALLYRANRDIPYNHSPGQQSYLYFQNFEATLTPYTESLVGAQAVKGDGTALTGNAVVKDGYRFASGPGFGNELNAVTIFMKGAPIRGEL